MAISPLSSSARHSIENPPNPNDTRLALKLFFSLFIFTQVLLNLNAVLDRDEKDMGSRLGNMSVGQLLNPTNYRIFGPSYNQTISNVSSWVGLKVFGVHPSSLRLPVLGFALLTLIILFFFTENFSFPTELLLYGHLTTNGLFIWYLGASKGYSPLICFSLLSLVLTLRLFKKEQTTRREAMGLGLALLALILSHTMGTLFFFALFAVSFYENQKTPKLFAHRWKMTFLFLTLVAAVIQWLHFHYLTLLGDLFRHHLPFVTNAVANWLGLVHSGTVRLLGGLTILLVFSFRRSTASLRSRFLFDFAFVTFSGLFILITCLQTRVFFGRYLLPFLIPSLTAFFCLLDEQKNPFRQRLGFGAAALFLILLPAYDQREITFMLTSNHRPIESFVSRVSKVVAPLDRSCIRYEGNFRQTEWMKKLLLPSPKNAPETCLKNYLIRFEVDPFDRPLSDLVTKQEGHAIFRSSGRVLYELQPGVGGGGSGNSQ